MEAIIQEPPLSLRVVGVMNTAHDATKASVNCVSGYNGSCLKGGRVPFGLAPPLKYPPDAAVYLKGQPQLDIIGRYRILLHQNEGWLARLPVPHPLRALDGGLTGGCFGNSSILGGHSSKADFYHFR